MEQFDYIGTTMGLGDSSPPNGVHGRSKGKPHPLQKPETNACVGLLYKKYQKIYIIRNKYVSIFV